MNMPSPRVLESLTYWLRLEDLLADPSVADRLIDQARQGLRMLQSGVDLTEWAHESQLLLREVDDQLREVGADADAIVSIGRSAAPVESLTSVLGAIAEVRPAASAGLSTESAFAL